MWSYLAKRLFLAFLTLLVIMLVSYFLMRLAPGDPTKSSSMLGDSSAGTQGLSAEKGAFAQNTSARKKLHLDEPIIVGFAYWIRDLALHGDLGTSVSVDKGRPVAAIIVERLPVTLTLNICAVFVTYLLALPLGICAAANPYSSWDRMVSFLLFLLYSLPSFWVALLLQASVCEGGRWGIFPLKGILAETTWGASIWKIWADTAMHYVLPVFCLAYAGFAGLSRYAKAGMMEAVRQDYIRTARAKGVSEASILFIHGFRNAMILQITLFAELIPGLVAGSIILEYVFSIPGMGSLSMLALTSRDIPLLMALFVFSGALTLGSILLADILYVLADPRISFHRRA